METEFNSAANEAFFHWWMWAWHKGWESYWALKALDDIRIQQLRALEAHRGCREGEESYPNHVRHIPPMRPARVR